MVQDLGPCWGGSGGRTLTHAEWSNVWIYERQPSFMGPAVILAPSRSVNCVNIDGVAGPCATEGGVPSHLWSENAAKTRKRLEFRNTLPTQVIECGTALLEENGIFPACPGIPAGIFPTTTPLVILEAVAPPDRGILQINNNNNIICPGLRRIVQRSRRSGSTQHTLH